LWIQMWHSFGVKTDTDNHWNFQAFYTHNEVRKSWAWMTDRSAVDHRLMVRQHLRNWFTRAIEAARQTVGTHQRPISADTVAID
jgi:hypothetical protein